jgi:antitoxin component YwqK of YwqJK toxin-antitoxin module
MTVLELLSLTPEQKEKGVFISGDKTQGEYKEWYSDGQLFMHCFYKNGKREGECKLWRSNGQLFMHCFYKNSVIIEEY